MYHKPFFSLPAWREPFSTVPRCQLITFCTYQKEETLGKVLRYQGQHIWRPTAWGMAATRALKAMQRNNQIAIIKEFTVMLNHIHLFIFYKKFHPRLPEWFIEKTREFLLYYIEPPRDWPVPIWEESVDTQMVYTDTAQYAVAESLKEYAHHWKYDPLHKR